MKRDILSVAKSQPGPVSWWSSTETRSRSSKFSWSHSHHWISHIRLVSWVSKSHITISGSFDHLDIMYTMKLLTWGKGLFVPPTHRYDASRRITAWKVTMLSRKIMKTSSAPTQPRYKGATTQSLKTLKLYGLNHYYRIYRFSATRGLLGKDISIRSRIYSAWQSKWT
jgi:hypothetical protein